MSLRGPHAPKRRAAAPAPVSLHAVTFAVALGLAAGCGEAGAVLQRTDPKPLAEPVLIRGLPVDGTVDRERAAALPVRWIELPRDPSTFDHSRLLGNGTLYRLELDEGAALVRIADVSKPELGSTRIPLVAPPGEAIRGEEGRYRVATSSPGLSIDRDGRGSVWWEEDGVEGRHIEFLIDGEVAEMAPPGPAEDDPDAPVRYRFDITPVDRELSLRLTTGGVNRPKGISRAYLGGRGFGVAIARLGTWQPEAFAELPAADIPHVDAVEHAPGVVTLTVGLVAGEGRAVQVTYDSRTRRWRDHRPLVEFPDAQGVEVGDVGAAGALVALILPWNGAADDPETELYWVRPGRPVRHLLERTRDLRTIPLTDGFIALFEDEFREDRDPSGLADMYVLRGQGEELSLYRFTRPGPCSASHFVSLGDGRFVATFCSQQAAEFTVP